jgi:transposase
MEEVSSRPERKYHHRSIAFKRHIVELSLRATTSVAKLAQEHGINANQIFAWRKAYRDGTLDSAVPLQLMPVDVRVSPPAVADPALTPPAGHLEITVGTARIQVVGTVDERMLRTAIQVLVGR